LHGGLSTGPKTEAGRARIAEAQRRRWRDYRERQLETKDGQSHDRDIGAHDRLDLTPRTDIPIFVA
jgi:hypothetical protein